METDFEIKMKSLYDMAKDTGYLMCIVDIKKIIDASVDESGKIDAALILFYLDSQIILLKPKHTTT